VLHDLSKPFVTRTDPTPVSYVQTVYTAAGPLQVVNLTRSQHTDCKAAPQGDYL
jgi:hypothetical protein